MTNQHLLTTLLRGYQNNFDIINPYSLNDQIFDAYAFCDITNVKYVLVKRAELWRANCYEHVFFRLFSTFTTSDMKEMLSCIKEYIEPGVIRKGEPVMPANHMYSYITFIGISQGEVSQEAIRAIKKSGYYKNYRFSLRGYCQARILVFDLAKKKIYSNSQAKELSKNFQSYLQEEKEK